MRRKLFIKKQYYKKKVFESAEVSSYSVRRSLRNTENILVQNLMYLICGQQRKNKNRQLFCVMNCLQHRIYLSMTSTKIFFLRFSTDSIPGWTFFQQLLLSENLPMSTVKILSSHILQPPTSQHA